MKKIITCLQYDSFIGQVDTNFTNMEHLIKKTLQGHPNTDILVLPETWNTGFYPSPQLAQAADPDGKRTQALMSQLAAEFQVNIVAGSVSTLRDNKVYNTLYVFNRQGCVIANFDKIHGFSPAHEQEFYTGGQSIPLFKLDELSCSAAICYDLRFPELIRKEALQGIDILFLPAQWPSKRLHHWRTLTMARAIENQCFVCDGNAVGAIKHTPLAGHSLVIDPWGEILLEMDDKVGSASVVIDTSILDPIRQKINVFKDRRPDIY